MKILPDIGMMIYSTVAFFILLFILGRFAFPPLIKMLDDRSNTIRDSLEGAEKTRLEAQRLLDEYKADLAKAREEAQKIIEDGRKFGESIKQEMTEKAKLEVEEISAKAAEEIRREKALALVELQTKMADLTIQAASKVVQSSLDKKQHEKLINDFISQAGSLNEN
ncbi:MAG TPA: ATP synthase F0 subunit B [Actinobacteria bacterium]|nr:ATP synthase F0 subunit B [Actinomycetes bacterium]HEX21254.1 ATP synthase F0 subunit B [Actinomycetota bacterium]